ncbi:MAG: potassium channel family protein [Cyanobacteria bacterium]|nr:potassium channel family protein [Cyanobacteriota bacterium]
MSDPDRSTFNPFQPRRHAVYVRLLAVCLLILVLFTLPQPWSGISSMAYQLMGVVMIHGLGNPDGDHSFGPMPRLLFKGLGIAALAVGVLWFLTPVELRQTGVPVIVLWSLFSLWSAARLIRSLALERAVNPAVLLGALAGYLMLGLAGGLIGAALETLVPGSFSNVAFSQQGLSMAEAVWRLNFIQINYFSFVSLTTVGYGDIIPLTPPAQMLSVAISITGTFYVAVVMGLLISRFTLQVEGRDAQ